MQAGDIITFIPAGSSTPIEAEVSAILSTGNLIVRLSNGSVEQISLEHVTNIDPVISKAKDAIVAILAKVDAGQELDSELLAQAREALRTI